MDLHSKKGSSRGKKQKTLKGPLELCYCANCKGLHRWKKPSSYANDVAWEDGS